jgi:diguanylate cyclase (GGDEF)-like protein
MGVRALSAIANRRALAFSSLTALDAILSENKRLLSQVSLLEEQVRALDRLAYTDPLVALPNRRSFEAASEALIDRVMRYGETASMIFVDVDGLKQINDRHGHQAGDAALIAVGKALKATARKSDVVARLSGDEFAILMSHADAPNAQRMALRIVKSVVSEKFFFEGKRIPLCVAVGASQIEPSDSLQSVVSRADRAMYAVKDARPRRRRKGPTFNDPVIL